MRARSILLALGAIHLACSGASTSTAGDGGGDAGTPPDATEPSDASIPDGGADGGADARDAGKEASGTDAGPPGDAGPDVGPDAGNVVFFDDFSGPSLSSAWTVISRHGEYAQSETECNVPQAVTLANGMLNIQTSAQRASCGDFNVDGTVRHAPSTWPYVTGDLQWKSLTFTYGTVTVRAKFPDQNTVTWPALWLLGSNCQNTNPNTADVGYDTCPDLGSPAYAEIDMVECDLNNWCQLALSNVGSFPTCGFQRDPLDTSFHVFTLTWTASAVSVSMDGAPTGCSFASPQWVIPSTPMFLIMQTQTGGAGGTPNDAMLPATFSIDYVQVTQP